LVRVEIALSLLLDLCSELQYLFRGTGMYVTHICNMLFLVSHTKNRDLANASLWDHLVHDLMH